ncbi:hypothetical protein LAZ29_03145 [Cereibacter sphaeroides]|uniref:hypothetical protein n=1 Tax=Cereibacter sphaeroides TaxID=1063 RepID=UPI001F235C2A|nr:hypothetical protein [Cereibacter sphaeroides]MCE6949920.1 hypothetical protein [Cereibacter sphaeroides]
MIHVVLPEDIPSRPGFTPARPTAISRNSAPGSPGYSFILIPSSVSRHSANLIFKATGSSRDPGEISSKGFARP